jgi:hypothetical protein
VVQIEYAIDFEEWYEAVAQLALRKFIWRYVIWTAILVTGIVLLASDLRRGTTPVVSAFVTIYAVIILTTIRWGYRRRMRRFFDRTPAISEHVVACFTADDANWTNPVTSSSVRWAAFSHWRETDLSFLLFRGPEYPFIVPKRAFLDDSQISAFRSLLAGKIGRVSAEAGRAFPVEPGTPG